MTASARATSTPGTPPPASPSAPSPTATPGDLRRMVGRMLVAGFRGQTLEPGTPVAAAIRAGDLGGVILFDRDQLTGTAGRNIASPRQLTALVAALRSAAPGHLFVAVDQEGGRVARLNPGNGFPASDSERALGRLGDPQETYRRKLALAQTLASVAIDVNLAPVVDLDIDPTSQAIGALERSFSPDPDVVIDQARATIRAHHDAGVRSVIKHFPGEGSGAGNTDVGFVDVTETWSRTELEPFRALIAPGLADAVMVGHILNGQLDAELPASLSQATVTRLLREDLGWDGVVISDDLQAAAITERFGQEEAIAWAIDAGVDLLLFANQQVYEPDIAGLIIDTVMALVDSGRIPASRIVESVARVERLAQPLA